MYSGGDLGIVGLRLAVEHRRAIQDAVERSTTMSQILDGEHEPVCGDAGWRFAQFAGHLPAR